MKAIISCTYDDMYLFNLPIVTWAWNQLGVEVECFLPNFNLAVDPRKTELATMRNRIKNIHFFNCPPEKAATYAQVSRLFGCCLNLPEDEILVTSDVDMLLLQLPKVTTANNLCIFGYDLVPENQYPMCYASASVKGWRDMLNYDNESYQEMLDKHLAHENCENMRGNLWSRDQELLYSYIKNCSPYHTVTPRARPGTQFASNRIDRDDSFWEERLSPDIIDAHLWRPLWKPTNFEKLLKLLRYFWPDEDFQWVIDYKNAYIQLL